MNRPLVVGNWKMNGTQSSCALLAGKIARGLRLHPAPVDVAIAPPSTALVAVRRALGKSPIALAAQNCHWQANGAFTGEISSVMLRDIGCDFVIIGHSERRQLFLESDSMIEKKLKAVIDNGLRAILCVGETLRERESGRATDVITRQLRSALKGLGKNVIDKIAIAYEPVWAIGTGHHANPSQISRVHRRIEQFLASLLGKSKGTECRILYGGSVNPDNAPDLAALKEVSGLLVGGASLQADTFLSIIRCFNKK